MTSRTCSILIEPISPGSMTMTSGCTPRWIRRQAGHSPQASRAGSAASLSVRLEPDTTSCCGLRQFTASAIAKAVRRLPTPAGPASSSAGGSVSRATAPESSVKRRRWPTIVRKGTKITLCAGWACDNARVHVVRGSGESWALDRSAPRRLGTRILRWRSAAMVKLLPAGPEGPALPDVT